MTGRRLKTHVHVRGQVYGPDSDVPPEVAERITNPDVWDGEEPAAAVAEQPDGDGDPDAAGSGEPPKAKRRNARSLTPPSK